jgi:HK97 family phage major capsid protein
MSTDIVQDIVSKIESMNEETRAAVSEDRIKAIVEQVVGDADFARKMRFGQSDARLFGSKFSRHGLQAADVEFLYDLMTARQRSGIGSGPSEELRTAFGAISDAQYMSEDEIKRIDGRALDELYPRVSKQQGRALEAAFRAMDTAESGFGSQLVGAQYVGDLWSQARPDSRVFSLIDTFEMSAPTAYLPVEVDIPEVLLVSESTANNSSAYSTSKTGSNRVQVNASKFVIHQMWSGEMEEDSIIPFVPFLRAQAAKAIAYYADSMVLNGDTTNAATGNINLDDADPADTKHYLAFDGIRHAAIVDNTANASNASGAVTLALLRGLKGLMLDGTRIADWGHPTDANDLVYVADPQTADAIAGLAEVVNARYNLAGNADFLNGEVGRIIGHPVISSMAVSKTEADYKVSTTGSNNVKGQVVAFNRNGLKAGWRRRVRVEVERIPATDQTRIVYSMRMGLGRFTPTGAASGIEWAAVLGNITV